MSRIIVKQLPKNITEEKLRGLFGSKGTLTDVQLKYTPDGKFRQFCFIGYRSEDDAQEAIKFFNNSCIQTSRIKVELCSHLGAGDKPKSWAKHTKDIISSSSKDESKNSEVTSNNKKVSKFDEIIEPHKDDPLFQEFLKVHDKNRILWANDAAEVNKTDEKAIKSDSEQETFCDKKSNRVSEKSSAEDDNINEEFATEETVDKKLAEKSISDLEYMKSLMINTNTVENKSKSEKKAKGGIDLFTIKMHNVPYKLKRQDVIKFFKPLKPYSVRLPTNVHGFCYVGFKTEKDMAKAMLKSKSFIKGKQVFFSDFTEKNKITKTKNANNDASIESANADNKNSSKNPKWEKQEENIRNEENISESGKIFFRNLAYTVTEDDLQKVFEEYGPIAEINLPVDLITRQIKGFGTVTFVMPEHAVKAFNNLDGSIFHGRLLHLIPGKNKDADNEIDENDASLSFKQKKALKLKKSAGDSVTWNTLFLGSNAVAEIIAKNFNTTKDKILDTSDGGSSAAVRIALGETQIVIEMKKFLEDNGLFLSAFEGPPTKRSKTIILAKNLPPNTEVAELTPIFAKFGPIGRLILPPSGVTAVIEYCDPSEARKAFKKLAYSKFKNVPLFLEWAPENTFKTSLDGEPLIPKQEEADDSEINIKHSKTAVHITDTEEESKKDRENVNNNGADDVIDDAIDEDADEAPESNTTLFLRNLNFKTVQDTVYKHFKSLGSIHTVEIAKKKDPNNPKTLVSLGYGFIQFKKQETAEKALKQMQFTHIDGNQVELKRSDRILKTSNTATQRKTPNITKQTGTKILVRNIPFQAKQKEIRDIFKAFGELRSLRLPVKMTPGEDSLRGFGFVDYITKSDAKKAFEALSQSTHLYGRRLVLEWASTTDKDVEEMRKRTAEQYQTSGTKKSKKSIFDVETIAARGNEDEDEN